MVVFYSRVIFPLLFLNACHCQKRACNSAKHLITHQTPATGAARVFASKAPTSPAPVTPAGGTLEAPRDGLPTPITHSHTNSFRGAGLAVARPQLSITASNAPSSDHNRSPGAAVFVTPDSERLPHPRQADHSGVY
ncbi:hypothetical protein J6590_037945 [Homalodisca vitripennis]|nr:hypothetical protein J6590_037945 [Homalodisca vitripennis]